MRRGLVALVAFTAVSAVALPSAASVPRRASDLTHEGGIAPYGSAPALAGAPASFNASDRQLNPGTEGFSLFSGSELFFILQRASHRRLADDRFTYRWSWRGELVSVTVKDCWPVEAGQTADPACPGSQYKPPYSGQKIFFERDGLGRLLTKTHTGTLPEGQMECDVYGSSCARPFIEKRRYLWDGETLVSEAAYAQDLPEGSEGPIRWRKSYVPGAAAVNGHPQVRVEIYDGAGANVVSEKLYSYIRDEQSTVTALVEERSGADLNRPPVTARYLYAPFGEAALDGGFETRRSVFDASMTSTVAGGQTKTQTVNPAVAIPGALRTILSAAADPATLAGVVLERRNTDGTWGALQAADLAIGQPSGGPEELQVMPLAGWQKGSTYRLRLTPGLTDASGRTAADATIATLDIPASGVPVFDQSNPVRFETFLAAGSDLGGSFPGGQPFLFQGMYFDNITGLGITKNRVYDPRSASWLSEDPLDDVDSPNVYGFVAMRPQEKTDPLGLGDATGTPTPVPVPRPTPTPAPPYFVNVGTSFALMSEPGRAQYAGNVSRTGGFSMQEAVALTNERYGISHWEKLKMWIITRDSRFVGPGVEFIAGVEMAAIGAVPMAEGGAITELGLALTSRVAAIERALAGVEGVTFEGSWYRNVRIGADPLKINPYSAMKGARYNPEGMGAMYGSANEVALAGEERFYNLLDPLLRERFLAKDVRIDHLLDLTNPEVRKRLGVEVEELVQNNYQLTQRIGESARKAGFKGIVFPAARADGGVNLALFEEAAMAAPKGAKPIPLPAPNP